jgi:hypothetical protein
MRKDGRYIKLRRFSFFVCQLMLMRLSVLAYSMLADALSLHNFHVLFRGGSL